MSFQSFPRIEMICNYMKIQPLLTLGAGKPRNFIHTAQDVFKFAFAQTHKGSGLKIGVSFSFVCGNEVTCCVKPE